MILRSVTKHVRDQNWVAVGIDFLIVVVGVFIGIQVANWNQAKLETDRFNDQLVNLHAEFTENLERMNGYDDRLESKFNDIATLRQIVAGEIQDVAGDELDRMLMNAFSVPINAVDRTSFDELMQSDTLRRLKDIGMREPMVRWGEAYSNLQRLESDTLTLRNQVFAPYAMNELGFAAMGEHYPAIADSIARSPFRNEVEQLRGNRTFDNVVTVQLGLTAACREFLNTLRDQTELVIEQIESAGIVSADD